MPERLEYFYYQHKRIAIGDVVRVTQTVGTTHKSLDVKIIGITGVGGKVTGIDYRDPRNGGIRTAAPKSIKVYVRSTKRLRAIQAR